MNAFVAEEPHHPIRWTSATLGNISYRCFDLARRRAQADMPLGNETNRFPSFKCINGAPGRSKRERLGDRTSSSSQG